MYKLIEDILQLESELSQIEWGEFDTLNNPLKYLLDDISPPLHPPSPLAPPVAAAPPVYTSNVKLKQERNLDVNHPYIKKPLNALKSSALHPPSPQLHTPHYQAEHMDGRDDQCTTSEAAPPMLEQLVMDASDVYYEPCQEDMKPGHLYSQSYGHSQGQDLPGQWSVGNVLTPVTMSHPHAGPPQYQPGQQSIGNFLTPMTISDPHAGLPQYQPGQWSIGNVTTPVTISNPHAGPPQYLPGQQSIGNFLTPGTISYPPAAASQTGQEIPIVSVPPSFEKHMQFFAMLNGEPVYLLPQALAPPVVAAAPPVNTSKVKLKKSRRKRNLDGNHPYVKKPPNAFMLFLREQRPYVDSDTLSLGSGHVNMILGQKWKSMPMEQQKRFYQQAEIEKELHLQQYPDWSAKKNYGQRIQRDRTQSKKIQYI